MFKTRASHSNTKRMINFVNKKNGISRLLAYVWLRVKRRPGAPHFVALGMAVGMAVNFIPIIGVHLPIGLALCYLLSADYIAFIVASSLANFFTLPLFWLMMYRVGAAVLGRLPKSDNAVQKLSWDLLIHKPMEVLLPMSVGGLILGAASAAVSYFITYEAVKVYQIKRQKTIMDRLETIAKASSYAMADNQDDDTAKR